MKSEKVRRLSTSSRKLSAWSVLTSKNLTELSFFAERGQSENPHSGRPGGTASFVVRGYLRADEWTRFIAAVPLLLLWCARTNRPRSHLPIRTEIFFSITQESTVRVRLHMCANVIDYNWLTGDFVLTFPLDFNYCWHYEIGMFLSLLLF